jgi:protein-tyrosine phosphatase
MFEYLYNTLQGIFFSRGADEIITGLWLGNYKSALDKSFLKAKDISVIINCTPDKPFITEIDNVVRRQGTQGIETYRIPVNDSLLERDLLLMQDYFKIIIPLLLKKYVIEKRSVLIHCHAGKQRSAILIAAFLKVLIDKDYISLIKIPPCVYGKEQFQYICNYILSKRPQVFTYGLRINFEPSYKRFFRIDISN